MRMRISSAIAQQMEQSSWIRRMFEIGSAAPPRARRRKCLRFLHRQPGCRTARRGDRRAAPHRRGESPAHPQLHAQRRVPGGSRHHGTPARRALRHPVHRRRHHDDQRRRRSHQYHPESHPRSRRRGDGTRSVLPRVPFLHREPWRPHRDRGDRPQFQPDPARIAAALTPRTRALILNSPNNPTGVVYSETVLRAVNRVLPDPCSSSATSPTVLSHSMERSLPKPSASSTVP